ncbi:MAG: general secretion pathway protein GspK [Acidobacteria bacterium]|nr:general secretion pathway protein GspK [Acidobacteriota bacterium]
MRVRIAEYRMWDVKHSTQPKSAESRSPGTRMSVICGPRSVATLDNRMGKMDNGQRTTDKAQFRIPHSAFRNPHLSERGSVLVLLAWILVALSLIALSFSSSVRMEAKATLNEVDLKQSYYIARSGVYYAMNRALLQALKTTTGDIASQQQNADEDLERGQLRFSMANGTAEITVTDETGKVNVNIAAEDVLRNLMAQVGLTRDVADGIVDGILDWRDADQDVHANGAEDSYYMGLNEPYHAKDGPLDNIEELLLVKGVSPEIFYGQKFKDDSGAEVTRGGLVNFLTTYTAINRININSAPVEVLASIPGMDEERAQAIVRRRMEKPFSSPTEVGEQLGMQGDVNAMANLSAFRSNVYSLRSVAHLNNRKIVSVIRCTFAVDMSSPTGYRIIYWNENNLEL